jgi:hypothetical protein
MYKHNVSLDLLEATMCQLAFPEEPWSTGQCRDTCRLSLQLAIFLLGKTKHVEDYHTLVIL